MSGDITSLARALGGAAIEKVYEYYDGPVLFTMLTSHSTRYLCSFAEERPETWICTQVTYPQLQDLESGKDDLLDAFLRRQEVVLVVDGLRMRRDPSTLMTGWLPEAGAKLTDT